MEHLQQAILGSIDHYGYFGLFVALALGNIGVPVGTRDRAAGRRRAHRDGAS